MTRLIVALLLLPGLAWAQDAKRQTYDGFVPMEGVEYYCTDSTGQRMELGEVLCITAGCQTWMARCDMSVNSPTWRKIQDGCPGASSGVSVYDRLQQAQPPV